MEMFYITVMNKDDVFEMTMFIYDMLMWLNEVLLYNELII